MKNNLLFLAILILFSFCSSDENLDSSAVSTIFPKMVKRKEGNRISTLYFEYIENRVSKITTDFGVTWIYTYDSNKKLLNRKIFYPGPNGNNFESFNYQHGPSFVKCINETNPFDEDKYYFFNQNNRVVERHYYEWTYLNKSYFEYDNNGRINKIIYDSNSSSNSSDFINIEYSNTNFAFKNVYPQFEFFDDFIWYGNTITNTPSKLTYKTGSQIFVKNFIITKNDQNFPTKIEYDNGDYIIFGY